MSAINNTESIEIPVDLAELKSALDNASDKNRNFLIVFLLVECYLCITVLGTSNLDFFLDNTQFSFPFVKLNISLLEFYFVAPLVLVAFHFNLLFNLLEHSKTLHEWLHHKETVRLRDFNLLHAFLFNTRAKYDVYDDKSTVKRPIDYHLLNFIIVAMVFVFPLCIQVLLLWQFAKCQSLLMSSWHCLMVGTSLFS